MANHPGSGSVGSRSNSARRARAREKARNTILLQDVNYYRHSGVVAESMRPLAMLANKEMRDWIADLGGEPNVSAQELSILQDAARVGIALKALLIEYLRDTTDRRVAATVGSLASVRRACLQAVGLSRRALEAVSLEDYVATRSASQDAPGDEISEQHDPVAGVVDEDEAGGEQ